MRVEKKKDIRAFEIMTKPVEAVRAQDSLLEVTRLFTDHNIGAAAVLDATGKPVGVITKTDVVRYAEEDNGNRIPDTVQNWMTPVIFSVKPDTTLKEISKRMVRYGIHHIFVQGKNGEPIAGIVSSFDVLRRVASE